MSVTNVEWYFSHCFSAVFIGTCVVMLHVFILQSVDGVYVCVAFSSEYKIINMDTGHVQELFSFDSGHVLPTITKISRVSFVRLVN